MNSTIFVGDFNCLLSEMDTSSSQEISKNLIKLSTINQAGLIEISEIFFQQQWNTFFSNTHDIYQDNILGHQTILKI